MLTVWASPVSGGEVVCSRLRPDLACTMQAWGVWVAINQQLCKGTLPQNIAGHLWAHQLQCSPVQLLTVQRRLQPGAGCEWRA